MFFYGLLITQYCYRFTTPETDSAYECPVALTQPPPQKSPNKFLITSPIIASDSVLSQDDYLCTQDAINLVQEDIQSLRKSFPHPILSRQQLVVSMGEEVRKLKKEVMYLVELLQNSMRHKEILQRRLSYFEKRKEDDLIHQSLEYGSVIGVWSCGSDTTSSSSIF